MVSVILMIVGLVAGLLSGSVGFGGGMILLPVITYFFMEWEWEWQCRVTLADHFDGSIVGNYHWTV